MKTQPITRDERAAPKVPHQSKGSLVRFPGSNLAARALGVHRSHLHRALTGERPSPTLVKKWKAWLKENPEFGKLNRKKALNPKS